MRFLRHLDLFEHSPDSEDGHFLSLLLQQFNLFLLEAVWVLCAEPPCLPALSPCLLSFVGSSFTSTTLFIWFKCQSHGFLVLFGQRLGHLRRAFHELSQAPFEHLRLRSVSCPAWLVLPDLPMRRQNFRFFFRSPI